jgi:hypothetical protein
MERALEFSSLRWGSGSLKSKSWMFITCARLVLTLVLIFDMLLSLLEWSLREILKSTGCTERLGQGGIRTKLSLGCSSVFGELHMKNVGWLLTRLMTLRIRCAPFLRF